MRCGPPAGALVAAPVQRGVRVQRAHAVAEPFAAAHHGLLAHHDTLSVVAMVLAGLSLIGVVVSTVLGQRGAVSVGAGRSAGPRLDLHYRRKRGRLGARGRAGDRRGIRDRAPRVRV